ncbi:unnamed protein product (macronuclear) [Paramecium tetraurelia]|uniref:Uncharacterized protein n=1 Tax=Paramecium tetraurelia TaxID=5888 RepID=A0DG52_PARTE|nr:uncharacterized protein GSPATT00002147001 [Paramecium tetraurelia]CAK82019.1 unnamed protein product [Paramecium tetraurelia]|eukprot:XP_001449416.1 hypothetical protein (macronuclear) [Paramecium tetraurelia strain d4-2]
MNNILSAICQVIKCNGIIWIFNVNEVSQSYSCQAASLISSILQIKNSSNVSKIQPIYNQEDNYQKNSNQANKIFQQINGSLSLPVRVLSQRQSSIYPPHILCYFIIFMDVCKFNRIQQYAFNLTFNYDTMNIFSFRYSYSKINIVFLQSFQLFSIPQTKAQSWSLPLIQLLFSSWFNKILSICQQ